jgi:hypothetical protein
MLKIASCSPMIISCHIPWSNQMGNEKAGKTSASVVDVFENYLGEHISRITSTTVAKLSPEQQLALSNLLATFVHESTLARTYFQESVLADYTCNPYFANHDHEQPALSKKLMHLILYYPRVLLQWDECEAFDSSHRFGIDRQYLGYLAEYVRNAADLFRRGILLPIDSRPLISDKARQDCWDLAHRLSGNVPLCKYARPRLPIRGVVKKGELKEFVEAFLTPVYEDLRLSRRTNAAPAFVDPVSDALFRYHLQRGRVQCNTQTEQGMLSSTLMALRLPALQDIAPADFIAIREQSEDFEEYRRVLGAAIRRVNERFTSGRNLDEIFHDEVAPLQFQVRQLQAARKDRSVGQFLKTTALTTTIGGISIALASGICESLGQNFDVLPKLIQTGAVPWVTLLYWLFFNRPNRNQERLLRFYNALYEDTRT